MANSRDGALIEACALYESKHVLVLNKPSGFAVHGGSGLSGGIIEILRATRTQEPFLELAPPSRSGYIRLSAGRQAAQRLVGAAPSVARCRDGEALPLPGQRAASGWRAAGRRTTAA